MLASEHFYQPRPLEAPHTDHGELGAQPTTSPHMEQVVTQLAAAHHVDLSQPGVQVTLDHPDQNHRWMFTNIDGERIGVTRFQVDEETRLAPDLDMVFAVTEFGWEPREIVHAENPWDEFFQAAQEQDLTVFDAQGNLRYDVFTEVWAQKIEQEGRLKEGQVLDASVDRTGGGVSDSTGTENSQQSLQSKERLTIAEPSIPLSLESPVNSSQADDDRVADTQIFGSPSRLKGRSRDLEELEILNQNCPSESPSGLPAPMVGENIPVYRLKPKITFCGFPATQDAWEELVKSPKEQHDNESP